MDNRPANSIIQSISDNQMNYLTPTPIKAITTSDLCFDLGYDLLIDQARDLMPDQTADLSNDQLLDQLYKATK